MNKIRIIVEVQILNVPLDNIEQEQRGHVFLVLKQLLRDELLVVKHGILGVISLTKLLTCVTLVPKQLMVSMQNVFI